MLKPFSRNCHDIMDPSNLFNRKPQVCMCVCFCVYLSDGERSHS